MKLPRFWEWYLTSALLFALLWLIRTPSVNLFLVGAQMPDGSIVGGFVPRDIIVLVYKASTITLGAIGGFLLDRSLYPYARPDEIVRDANDAEPWSMGDAVAFSGACIRRAIIVIGFVMAFSLAL